jgi:hypothetical protein
MAVFNSYGTKIAFTIGRNLYIMNNYGSVMHEALLYSEAVCDSPTYVFWSKDGTQLAQLSPGYDNYSNCVIFTDETGLL